MLRLRGLQETSNQDLRPFRRSRRVEQLLSALPHLLPPHRAIETFARELIFVMATLYNSPPFQYVNAIRVQDGRDPVGDQYRDRVTSQVDIPNVVTYIYIILK